MLVICSKKVATKYLRQAIILSGIKYKCLECGIGPEYNKKTLVLQIDHINGNNLDNRLENLRFLCPNCHSQTDNFGAKKLKKYFKPNILCPDCKINIIQTRYSKRCDNCLKVHIRKVQRPNKEELKKLIWELPTTKIAKKYGVSDKAVEKWCKDYELDKPPRGYWQKRYSNNEISM